MQPKLTLKVQFFGNFSLYDTDGKLLLEQTRNNKSLYLLEYLIYHREEGISRNKLIELLCDEDDIGNPGNTLKIIIHRARRMLEETGITGIDSIIYSRGKYHWNHEIACETDYDRFIDLLRAADNAQDADAESALLLEAIHLHRGSFLGRTAREPWAISTSYRFRNYYISALERLSTLYAAQNAYDRLLALIQHALDIYGDAEDLHYLHTCCLYDMGRKSESLVAYKQALNSMTAVAGMPGRKLEELQQRIHDEQTRSHDHLHLIKDQLGEQKRDGAFYCPFSSFAENYRYILRTAERSGQELHLMLCTLADTEGRPIDSESQVANAAEALNIVIKSTLRRVDLYTRYSAGHFLLLLPNIKEADCDIVCRRLADNFAQQYQWQDIRLLFEIENPTADRHILY